MCVANIGLIKKIVENQFIPTTKITKFLISLSLLPDIFKFLKIMNIPDMALYKCSLEQFESNLKLLYSCGNTTFLKDDDKPFYFHCMCFYLPKIARETLEKHKQM